MHIESLLNPCQIDTNLNLSEDELSSGSTCYSSSNVKLFPTKVESTTNQSPRFYCPEEGCFKHFNRKYNLSAHLRCHTFERPYSCRSCPLKFARKHDLTRHIKSKHDVIKSYGPCKYCGNRFARSDAYGRHMKVEVERRSAAGGMLL